MVSIISPALLLVFCLGVTTSQRKYSRHVPVSTSVKTGVNFDCPEEFGYYPHPTDCTQYYVCVFGGALLESCTGGLMYSHELQTCDWPRNVGCDGLELSASPAAVSVSASTSSRGRERERERDREREREEPRTRYTPPPPPSQPAAVVTSRGQPRQLQTKQEFIKQQQQLYTEAEESLPPAEEVENDRQQRVYRGQPSTGQRDRDGIRNSNAIPTYSGRGEKIGVISFGTQNQHYSRQHEGLNRWHGVRRTKNAAQVTPVLPFFGNHAQKSKRNEAFIPSVPLPQFSVSQEGDDFKPFIPDYFKPNSYQNFAVKMEPLRTQFTKSTNNQYYYTLPNQGSANSRPRNGRPYLISPGSLLLEAAHSQVIPEIRPTQQLPTYPEGESQVEDTMVREFDKHSSKESPPYTQSTNPTEQESQLTQALTKGFDTLPISQVNLTVGEEERKEENDSTNSNTKEDDGTSTYDEEVEHYEPPPEFLKDENKYENIHNPFADPNFDFDKFLNGFTTSTSTTTTTTAKPRIKVIHYYQPLPSNILANKQSKPQIIKTSTPLTTKTMKSFIEKVINHDNDETIVESIPSVTISPSKFNTNEEFETTARNNYEVHEVQELLDSPTNRIPQGKSTVESIIQEKSIIRDKSLVGNIHQDKSSISDRNEYAAHLQTSPNTKTLIDEYFESSTQPQPTTMYDSTTILFKDTSAFEITSNTPKRTSSTLPSNQELSSFKIVGTTPKRTTTTPKQKQLLAVKNDYYYEYEDVVPQTSRNSSIYTNDPKVQPKKASDEYEYYYDYDYALVPKNETNNKNSPAIDYYQKVTTSSRPPITSAQVDIRITHPTTNRNKAPRGYDSHKAQSINSANTATPTTSSSSTTTKYRKNKNGLTTEKYNRENKRGQSKFSKSDGTSSAPQPTASTSSQATRASSAYNSSQYSNNQYEPYYALYDDDVELYRDDEYSQNNYNTNSARAQTSSTYRGTPAPSAQATSLRQEAPKRGKPVYLQNNNYNQDIYQQSTVSDYDNRYDSQVDDQTAYRQSNRQPSRGDRNDINDVEEVTKKRTTSTSTTRKPTTTTSPTTTTTTPRTTPYQKSTLPPTSETPETSNVIPIQDQSIIDKVLLIDSGIPLNKSTSILIKQDKKHNDTFDLPVTYRPTNRKFNFLSSQHESNKSNNFPEHLDLTTNKPTFHYITKQPRIPTSRPSTSTSSINSRIRNSGRYTEMSYTTPSTNTPTPSPSTQKNIHPTTYSPPKFFLKSILPKSSAMHTVPLYSVRPSNRSESFNTNFNRTATNQDNSWKALKAVRKLISPVNVNHGLSRSIEASYDSAEKIAETLPSDSEFWSREYSSPPKDQDQMSSILEKSVVNSITSTTEKPTVKTTTPKPTTTSTTTEITTTSTTTELTTSQTTKSPELEVVLVVSENEPFDQEYVSKKVQSRFDNEKLKYYTDDVQKNNTISQKNKFRATIEVPTPNHLTHAEKEEVKPEPDQPPTFKVKPKLSSSIPITLPLNITKTNTTQTNSTPSRISRVNTAIKSLIAIGGSRRTNSKCLENEKCSTDPKRRASTRGRGTAHYSGQISNNEVTVNTNRGTAPPRARPTLKPSTSIVSKATEFVDIYRYPPRRPDPIYPQPQPDKTAAKCRKDVCLLPDCSCGGKEIPGNLPAEETPQIVLITFDDAINDLNKEYYREIFENGRKNPNGCPISATFYISHEWTDYSQVQNLYADGHEMASHTVSHSFGEQFSQKKWTKEIAGQREILAAYGGVHLEDIRGMRAPFLSVGGNKMFKMLYDSNFTYDSSMPIYENKPPSWPYTLDYKLFHDCMIPPCPTRSYPGVWEVPMVMWQDLNGGRCSMGDACSNPPDADGVFKMLTKNFQRHYTTNRAPFGLFYHAAWFTQPHHKEGFINFIDSILQMKDVWLTTNWQAIQWVRDPTPISKLNSFQPFQCDFSDRPKRCNNPKVCNLWHKSGVRYMRTCQPCPDIYPWTGNTGIRSSRIDNEIEE